MANYIKPGPPGVSPDKREEAMAMAKPLTPKSERRRSSYGSLLVSVQTLQGLCEVGVKCVRKAGHSNKCWPE